MKISNTTQSYTIDENEVIDTANGQNGHIDICNDIVAMSLPDNAPEEVFFDTIQHACDNLPENGTFAEFDRLCREYNASIQ